MGEEIFPARQPCSHKANIFNLLKFVKSGEPIAPLSAMVNRWLFLQSMKLHKKFQG